MSDPLRTVVLAISSFKSDKPVLRLLEATFEQGILPFHSVVVVDSLGSGRLAQEIEKRDWPVRYHNADTNLGSAGNLAMRLGLASESGADWCYAVNHDGVIDFEKIRRLLEHGRSRGRIGAVYPQLIYPRRAGAVDAPRRKLAPHAEFDSRSEPGDPVEVSWGSSNCALYNLAAVRAGVDVRSDLWMGWEDLHYGWRLRAAGWQQLQCPDVLITDSYEYRPVRFLGHSTWITDKPSWYVYYNIRNVILIAKESGGAAVGQFGILRRLVIELATTILFRQEKVKRLKLLAAGLRDGLGARSGKGPAP